MFLECLGGTEWLTSCGNVCIPAEVARYTKMIYNAIRIIAPLLLIIIGMFDLAKAVTSKSEEDVKKAQKLLVKKAIAGLLVFFMFSFVSWMLTILSSTSADPDAEAVNANVINCLNALFIEGENGYNSEKGMENGVVDPESFCHHYNYDGIMKIVGDGGAQWYYTCYKFLKGEDCNANNEQKYILSDGQEACLARYNNKNNNGATGADMDISAKVSCNSSFCGAFDSKETCKNECMDILGTNFLTAELMLDKGKNRNACLCVGQLQSD